MNAVQSARSAPDVPTVRAERAPRPPAMGPGLDLATLVMALRSASQQEEERGEVDEIREASELRNAQVEARLREQLEVLKASDDASWWQSLGEVLKYVGAGIGLALGVAGAAFTGGTSMAGSIALFAALTAVQCAGPQLADEIGQACGADPKTLQWLKLGVAIAGAVGSLFVPTNAAGAFANVIRIGRATGEVAQGSCQIGSAVCLDDQGEHQASAVRHEARAQAAASQVGESLQDLQGVLDRAARASRSALAMMSTENEGARAALRA